MPLANALLLRIAALAASWLPGQPAPLLANSPPGGSDTTLTINEDTTHVFSAADFGFTDPGDVPSHAFAGVKLSTLPGKGSLTLDSQAVNAGDFVSMNPVPGILWTPRETNRGWGSVTISADGTKLAAIGSGNQGSRLYKSTDSGVTWTVGGAPLSWADLAASTDGRRLVASAYLGHLYTSTDFGNTWILRETSRQWGAVSSSADGEKLAAIDENSGTPRLYTSVDAGLTWILRNSAPGCLVIKISQDGTKMMGIAADGRCYTSTDFGTNWGARGSIGVWSRQMASSADGIKLAAVHHDYIPASNGAIRGVICTSQDSGNSWFIRESNRHWSAIASSADGNTLVATEEGGQIHLSRDSGVTWTVRAPIQSWWSIACSADGSKLVAGGEQLYTSGATVPVLAYTPGENALGNPYANFSFQVVDDGPEPGKMDPSPNFVTLKVQNVNDAPTAAEPLADQSAPTGNPFSFQFAPSVFADIDAETVLTYSATRRDGSALPAWLSFTPGVRTFSGTPGDADWGTFEITVTAVDNGTPSLSTSAGFRITVGSDAPAGTNGSATLNEDTPYTFEVTEFGFTDPGDSPANQFTRVKITSLPTLGSLAVEGIPLVAGEFVATILEARQTWIPRDFAHNYTSIASSADGAKLAATDGIAIYLSTDSGSTWTARQSGFAWEAVASSNDGTKLVAAVYNGQIHTSYDSGTTWTARDVPRAWTAVASSADGTKLAAVVNGGQIQTSQDSGATWTPRETSRNWKAIAASADGTRLVAAVNSGQIHISSDSGVTWTARETNRVWYAVTSSADGNKLAAVDGNSIYLSSDAGISWASTEPGRAYHDIASSADGTRLVTVAHNGRIYTSRNSGETWTAREAATAWRCAASSADGNRLVAAGQNVRIHTSTASIPQLVFTPASNAFGNPYTTFSFQVEDAGTGGPRLDPVPRTFTLNVNPVNDRPALTNQLLDRNATEGVPFLYQFNISNFSDVDEGTILTYTASQSDDGPLPAWLDFSPAVRTFSGTPGTVDPRLWEVKVTATDNGVPSLSRSDIFTISVTGVDEVPAGTDGQATLAFGTSYSFSAGDFGFTDPNDFPADGFTRIKLTTAPAMGSLTVNGAVLAPGAFARVLPSSAGAVWKASPSGTRNWYSIASSADGTKLVAVDQASATGRIYTSSDSGATWVARESARLWFGVASSADGTKLVATVNNGRIYTSVDSGASWTARAVTRAWRSVCSSRDGNKLVAADFGGHLYTSPDSGVTWVERDSNRSWYSLASSADGIQLAAVVYGGNVYTSADSGVTWTPRGNVANWRAITSSSDGTKLAAIVDSGRIFTSSDSGMTWLPRETSRKWYSIVSSADGTRLAAVVQDGRIYLSGDSGITWVARETNRNWRTITSSGDGTKLAAIVTGGQIYISDILPAQTLVFTPAPGGHGTPYTSFTFQVEDDGDAPANIDPTANSFVLNMRAPGPFQAWALENALPNDPLANGGVNLVNFSFGLNPDATGAGVISTNGATIVHRGTPALLPGAAGSGKFRTLFGRRKDSGLETIVQFSADLKTWENNLTPPTIIAQDAIVEACEVPFPTVLQDGRLPTFFRISITLP